MKNQKKRKLKKNKKKNFKKMLHKKIQTTLLKHLGWNKSIANFTATIVCSLLSVTGIWLKKIAQASDGDAQVDSTIRRLQRFFCSFVINYHCASAMIYQLLGIKGKLTIILDRTNWDYGKSHINVFVAAALYQQAGIDQSFALPLIWEVFDKKGNSNTCERKQLMKRLFDVVGKDNIEVILGDREFIGDEWISFLHENNIPFIIRIKKNMYVEFNEKRVSVLALVALVKYKEKLKFNVKMGNTPAQLVATRSVDGELVIVIASASITYDPLDQYKMRWLIELFFKSTKTKGFNLEETHMTDPAKIKSLFFLIALASLCAVHAGIIKHMFKKIQRKNHGRPTYSLFTYGLDFLRALFRGVVPNFLFTKINTTEPIGFFFLPHQQKQLLALRLG